jgi:AcrR family transcriptional regulator
LAKSLAYNKINKKENKRSLQAKKTKLVIMNNSIKLFARQGYHKTTINEICRSSKVTSGAFFGHFPSKKKLLLEVIDSTEEKIRRSFEGLYFNGDEPGKFEKLEELFSRMIDFFSKEGQAIICFAALTTEFAGSKTQIEKRVKDLFVVTAETFYHIVKNHPNVKDPQAVAISLLGAAQGCAIQSFMGTGEMSFERLIKGLLTILKEW